MFRHINKDALVIDVREKEERENSSSKIKQNSINVPLKNLKRYMLKNRINKNKQILVFCQSGVRSKVACSILKDMGYINAVDIGSVDNLKFIL